MCRCSCTCYNTSSVRTSCSSSVSPQKPAIKSLESPSPMPPGLLPPIIALAFATNPSYACEEDEEDEIEEKEGGGGGEGGGEGRREGGRRSRSR